MCDSKGSDNSEELVRALECDKPRHYDHQKEDDDDAGMQHFFFALLELPSLGRTMCHIVWHADEAERMGEKSDTSLGSPIGLRVM